MTNRSIAGLVSGVLFIVTVALGLAGADKPPPLGFLWLVTALAAVCYLGFFQLMRRLNARAAGGGWLAARMALEGALAGIAIMLTLMAVGGAEPQVDVTVTGRLVGAVVFGCAGCLAALAAWLAAAGLQSRFGRSRRQPPA
jgi:hypothetical protein